jgi:hypothetical protein
LFLCWPGGTDDRRLYLLVSGREIAGGERRREEWRGGERRRERRREEERGGERRREEWRGRCDREDDSKLYCGGERSGEEERGGEEERRGKRRRGVRREEKEEKRHHLKTFTVSMFPKQIRPMYEEALLGKSTWRNVKDGIRVKLLEGAKEREHVMHRVFFF